MATPVNSQSASALASTRSLPLQPTSPPGLRSQANLAATSPAVKRGLDKARKANRIAATARKSQKLAGTWVLRNQDLDEEFVRQWQEEHPEYYSFLEGIIANGVLQREFRAYKEKKNFAAQQATAGIACFAEGACKWKGLQARPAVELLNGFVNIDIKQWFFGTDALEIHIAPKACKFLCGVQDYTPVPSGHEVGQYSGHLLPLVKKRIDTIGLKVDPTLLTKDNIDNLTNWFRYVSASACDALAGSVIFNDHPTSPTKLVLPAVKLTVVDDWIVLDGHSFFEATLYSKEKNAHTVFLWRAVPDDKMPCFDDGFHYTD